MLHHEMHPVLNAEDVGPGVVVGEWSATHTMDLQLLWIEDAGSACSLGQLITFSSNNSIKEGCPGFSWP
ncbi:hypothetical protein SLA2020_431180 [Shorea laevis]